MKKLDLMNQVFLMKIGWGLMNNKKNLSARVLKAKYKCGVDLIPTVKNHSGASNVWNGVTRTWEKMKHHTCWHNEENAMVADFTTVSGGWDWIKIHNLLSTNICDLIVLGEKEDDAQIGFGTAPNRSNPAQQIAGCPPPNENIGDDNFRWILTKDGKFSIKTTYPTKLYPGATLITMKACGRIYGGGQSCREFGLTTDSKCLRCKRDNEDTMHAVRDCHTVRNVWQQLKKLQYWEGFFNKDMNEWVVWNWRVNIGNDDLGDWRTIFGAACWGAWCQRNERSMTLRALECRILKHSCGVTGHLPSLQSFK
ncbi:putative ribonuclease H protein At1g65750 family [Senna tora]|uniref:Putative ribonuclease H protein At1g65750 family n=1 Tax=Senna tora TaxID=362788 RepID=A0A834SFX4_9FABA|nr:putative ribonuclease H protein At1g65750 family [Senna tora]